MKKLEMKYNEETKKAVSHEEDGVFAFFEVDDYEYYIIRQNILHYKVEGEKLVRFDETEDEITKKLYLKRIRRHRQRAFKAYDIYERKVIRGLIQEDSEIEQWYKWALDFTETYNNNIPYHEQINHMPERLKNFT